MFVWIVFCLYFSAFYLEFDRQPLLIRHVINMKGRVTRTRQALQVSFAFKPSQFENKRKFNTMKLKRFLLRYYPPGTSFLFVLTIRAQLFPPLPCHLFLATTRDNDLVHCFFSFLSFFLTLSLFFSFLSSSFFFLLLLISFFFLGIILQYSQRDGSEGQKEIPLLHLTTETDVEVLVNQIVFEQPLVRESRKPQLRRLIYKLIEKLEANETQDFYLFKILRAHILPLTNCAFNKSGDKFITGSYDRTCKVWDTNSGEELLTLEGHKNVVYAIAFNNPYGDKIITGSFDKTCKLWSAETGVLFHTFRGHATEIVCLAFNPSGDVVATGSMDNTAKLWDVNTGKEIHTLLGHTAEIVSLNFNTDGTQVITGSFDHTIKLWDCSTGTCIHTLSGHHGEISSTQFNFSSELCISGSIDRTCKIWNVKTGQCLQTLRGHNDEILDVAFNATGSKVSWLLVVVVIFVNFFLKIIADFFFLIFFFRLSHFYSLALALCVCVCSW